MKTRCPVRGHDHELLTVREVVQTGTGVKGWVLECPTKPHRWFVVEGRQPGPYNKLMRPRWGWKD